MTSTTTITAAPTAARPAEQPTGSATAVDAATARRLAALVDQLQERDRRHLEARAVRRPAVWIGGLTAAAVAVAHVAVLLAVPLTTW